MSQNSRHTNNPSADTTGDEQPNAGQNQDQFPTNPESSTHSEPLPLKSEMSGVNLILPFELTGTDVQTANGNAPSRHLVSSNGAYEQEIRSMMRGMSGVTYSANGAANDDIRDSPSMGSPTASSDDDDASNPRFRKLVDDDDSDEEDVTILVPQGTSTIKSVPSGPNYKFYSGQIKSRPDGDFIDNIHRNWFWNYNLLEAHHGFIQWIFPVFENSGVNFHAESLRKDEAKAMREDFTIACRFIWSYRMMLNFYGMRLADLETGTIERIEHYEGRYLNLKFASHNYLRINRILASLGHVGFHRYRRPFIEFLQIEVRASDSLIKGCKNSLSNFWEDALTPESAKYTRKSRESAEDRVDSIFFTHLRNQSTSYLTWVKEFDEWYQDSAPARLEATSADIKEWVNWKG